jgi:hypothetical protein
MADAFCERRTLAMFVERLNPATNMVLVVAGMQSHARRRRAAALLSHGACSS